MLSEAICVVVNTCTVEEVSVSADLIKLWETLNEHGCI